MKKRIGILGGISLASTLEYARTIAQLYYDRFQDYYYPEIVIYSLDFQKFTDMENEGRTEDYIRYILQGLQALAAAGADFALMAANSPHSVYRQVSAQCPIPLCSIVDAVGQAAQRRGMKTLLLTGIRYTMQGRFYPDTLREKYGISVLTPDSLDQDIINDIIFGRLAREIITQEDREAFLAILGKYPADGVILGCTELPLLVHQEDTEIPLLPTLQLHCRMALDKALEETT